jgi:hypothetical protein
MNSLSLSCATSNHVYRSEITCRVEITSVMTMDGDVQDIGIIPESPLRAVSMMYIPTVSNYPLDKSLTNPRSGPSLQDPVSESPLLRQRHC